MWFLKELALTRETNNPATAEDYITALHQLARGCEYGNMTEELIRDRLVVGIKDESLSEMPQIESDFTLEKAKEFVRQRKAIKQQQSILKGNKDTFEAMYVNRNKPPGKGQKRLPTTSKQAITTPENLQTMWKLLHPRQLCPANNVTCFRCNRKGHFSS